MMLDPHVMMFRTTCPTVTAVPPHSLILCGVKVDRSVFGAAVAARARAEWDAAMRAARQDADAVRADAAARLAAAAARERDAEARLRHAASEADARAAASARELRRRHVWWLLRKSILLIGLRHHMKVLCRAESRQAAVRITKRQ
jgi:hypothetical protein